MSKKEVSAIKMDQNKVLVMVLFFVFLLCFFILLAAFRNAIFLQFVFLTASLTIIFTGLFHATGVFKTKGQQLGGAAAIFVIMLTVIIGGNTTFIGEDYNNLKGEIRDLTGEKEEKFEVALGQLKEIVGAYRIWLQHKNLKLFVDLRGKSNTIELVPEIVRVEGEKIAIPLRKIKEEQKVDIISTPKGESPLKGEETFRLSYSHEEPEVSVEWFPANTVKMIEFAFKNHKAEKEPSIEIKYEIKD